MSWSVLREHFEIMSLCKAHFLQTYQKKALNPITDGCEPLCGCWELNSGPLEEQSMLLTAEPSLQPPSLSLIIYHMCIGICLHVKYVCVMDVGFPETSYRQL